MWLSRQLLLYSKRAVIRTVGLVVIFALLSLTTKEAAGFLRGWSPKCRWYLEAVRELAAQVDSHALCRCGNVLCLLRKKSVRKN
jgi:hypothetical protein